MRWSTAIEIARSSSEFRNLSVAELQERLLIREKMADLNSVLRKFVNLQSLLSSTEILERLAFETCEDAFNDGVLVLELRFSPTFIAEGHSQLSHDQIVDAFQRGVTRAEKTFPMAVGLILIFQRTKPIPESLHLRDWALTRKSDFVGVDLADSEIDNPPEKFIEIFEPFFGNWNITIHAGESPHPETKLGVLNAINLLHASRIGHGIQVADDDKICAVLREKNVTLEVCPWSNYLTQSVENYIDHPLPRLLTKNISVCLNTDDPGVFSNTLVDEYHLATRYLGITKNQLQKMNQNALAASFINTTKIQRVWPSDWY